ncbi:MAG: hypothetical protein SAK29_34545 [Scytonema sp. PMC 1069.18]|nr:hypothetical protein [Scytonema sp. PMC 1069.18]MEC4887382.1 hypothetical protein [Scytonema sp. PMC 1070.18]
MQRLILIKHKKTGETLRYSIPDSTRLLLDKWNREKKQQARYDAVMNAPENSLFEVEKF